MDVNKYQAFLRTAELGNITRAAEELGYTQSAVSRIVADLEGEWGLQLLTRNRTGVVLSAAGEALLPYLRAVCAAQRALWEQVGELHGLTRGRLRIGTITSISVHWLPQIMKSFLARYPGIDFELVGSVEYREIEDWIAKGEVDCGFLALPVSLPLDTVFLRRDRQLAVLPEDHPLAALEAVPVARLAEEPFIKLEDDRDREIVRIFDRYGLRPNIRYTVNDDYAVMAMVENGLGVSILPELVLKDNRHALVTRPLDAPEFRDIGLAVSHTDALSPAAAKFLPHVKAWVEEHG